MYWFDMRKKNIFFLIVVDPRQAIVNLRMCFGHEKAFPKTHYLYRVGLRCVDPSISGIISSCTPQMEEENRPSKPGVKNKKNSKEICEVERVFDS